MKESELQLCCLFLLSISAVLDVGLITGIQQLAQRLLFIGLQLPFLLWHALLALLLLAFAPLFCSPLLLAFTRRLHLAVQSCQPETPP